MIRRSLFRAVLAAAAPLALATSATAAPTGGSGTARTGTWVTLPGTGLQVHCTDATGRSSTVPVTWTADGTVTATWPVPLTAAAPAGRDQRVTMAGGYGLAVRRAAP